MELKGCRSCGVSGLVSVLDLGEQPWCNDFRLPEDADEVKVYPLHLVLCRMCGLLQLDYTVPKEVMFLEHDYLSGMTTTLAQHFYDLAKENIEQFDLKPSDIIVDIGGNDGTQLLQYKKLGLRKGINIESAKNIAEISASQGVRTVNNFFNEEIVRTGFEEGTIKLISAAGVFFHLEELHSAIKGIKYLLSRDGVFVAQCMYAGELVKNKSFDMIYHEHLCYYTLRSLMRLLEFYGLTVFDAYHSPIHSGSLIAKICHTNQYQKTDRFKETLEMDEEFSYLSSFDDFADTIRKKRYELKNFLLSLKEKGATIYAYGAPAKGNTLLNYEEIDNSIVDKAVEINELKVGKVLPLSNIPIEKEDKDDYPDYYLLLSHNFVGEILEKNKELLDKGVKFIVPFPEVTVIEQ